MAGYFSSCPPGCVRRVLHVHRLSTGGLDDPYARLRRPADVLNTAAYEERREADAARLRCAACTAVCAAG
jgi:hypothetical protein